MAAQSAGGVEWKRFAVLAVSLVLALLAMGAFASSYIGAFHAPTPHHVRVGVVGPGAAAAVDASRGAFVAVQEPSVGAIRADLRSRRIAAALAGSALYVASGESYTTAATVTTLFTKQAPGLEVVDVAPLQAGDPRGTTLFYLVIAFVFGGYLAATLTSLLLGYGSHTRRWAAARIGALGVFSCFAGLLGAAIVHGYGAVTGHFSALWWIGALVVFAAAAVTSALQTALGLAGTGLALVIFIIVGNASSGGPYQLSFAPALFRAVGPYLPQAPGISALRGAVYFDGANIGGRLAVLAVYAAAGSVVSILIGRRHGPRADELELAAAAAL